MGLAFNNFSINLVQQFSKLHIKKFYRKKNFKIINYIKVTRIEKKR